MSSTAFDLIREAITRKCSIRAVYKGHIREMSPHILGYKNGSEHALFYQYGGSSNSGLAQPGSPTNWRCLFVHDISDVSIIEGVFETAPNHTQPQTCVDHVVAVVAY